MAGGIGLSPWFVILFVFVLAAYSLIWFGLRRNRRYTKENILMATSRIVEHDYVSNYMIYVGLGLAALSLIILVLLVLHIL